MDGGDEFSSKSYDECGVEHTLLGGLAYRAMVGTAMAFRFCFGFFAFFFFFSCVGSQDHTHKSFNKLIKTEF